MTPADVELTIDELSTAAGSVMNPSRKPDSKADALAFADELKRFLDGDGFSQQPPWLPTKLWFGPEVTPIFALVGVASALAAPQTYDARYGKFVDERDYDLSNASKRQAMVQSALINAITECRRLCRDTAFRKMLHNVAEADLPFAVAAYVQQSGSAKRGRA